MKILSIKQPWANAIIHLGKDIENRTWKTNYRGRFLVHASLQGDKKAPQELWDKLPEEVPIFGGIIGSVELWDCIDSAEFNPNSKWWDGSRFAFQLREPKPLNYMKLKGRLGFFDIPTDSGYCLLCGGWTKGDSSDFSDREWCGCDEL